MGFFDFMRGPDFSAGIEQYRSTDGAVLLDVRTEEEYRQGRVPGSRNLPLSSISRAEGTVPDKTTPLFVYCLSGARSSRAVSELKRMGYENVTNIGGISAYRGKTERG